MTNRSYFKTRIHIFLVIMNLFILLSSYRKQAEKTVIAKEDHHRAETKVPRHDYKGMDFTGGFQLLDLIIKELKSHMTCYKFIGGHFICQKKILYKICSPV